MRHSQRTTELHVDKLRRLPGGGVRAMRGELCKDSAGPQESIPSATCRVMTEGRTITLHCLSVCLSYLAATSSTT